MSVADIYINQNKGSKVAVRVVNNEASADVIAHFELADFQGDDEDSVEYINVDRVIYSGGVQIWRKGVASANSETHIASSLTTTSADPVMQLSGNGDFDLTKTGIVYQGENDQTLSVVVESGGTCYLHLTKGSTYVSVY